ncbi:MAG: Double zinc ribbon [Bacteroidota bacterium]|nr:Double zinc ribbon [Bacteroidota bacterium]
MIIDNRYHYEFSEDTYGVFGALLSLGTTLLLDSDRLGWICKFYDPITKLESREFDENRQLAFDKAYMSIKVSVMNFELDEAYKKKQLELEQKRIEEERKRQIEYEKALKNQHAGSNEDSNDSLLKFLIYGALIIGAIWLVFTFAIPLIILDISIVCFIWSLFSKNHKVYLLIGSISGAIYCTFDYQLGWLARSLVQNASPFKQILPYIFYVNLTTGVISIILLIKKFSDKSTDDENLLLIETAQEDEEELFLQTENTIVKNHVTSTLNTDFSSSNEHSLNDTNPLTRGIYCNNCKTVCTDENIFCENCGSKLSHNTFTPDGDKTCQICSYNIDAGFNFCENCGNKLN